MTAIAILAAATISFSGEFDRELTGAEYSGVSRVPGTDRYWVVDDNDGVVAEMKIEVGEGCSSTGTVLRTVQLAGRRDIEGCAVDPLRKGVLWVSDEADHSVRAFDIENARETDRLAVPGIYAKCRRNRSLEALSISPDGLEMWISNEEPIPGDNGFVRITRFSRDGASSAWKADEKCVRYRPDPVSGEKFMGRHANSGVSGLLALGKGRLLVLERECSVKDGGSLPSLRARIYECAADGSKTLLWEMDTGFANYEGICLGPEFASGEKSVVLVSDGGNGGDEKIMVLRLRD